MSTIPLTMKSISQDIHAAFEDLMKLLLRKSLRPTLNPLGPNARIIYNNAKCRYERGFVGCNSDDIVNKYSYLMTHDTLGWVGEILSNFKVIAKFIKNSTQSQSALSKTICPNKCTPCSTKSIISLQRKKRSSCLDDCSQPAHFNSFLSFLASKSIPTVIANKIGAFTYTADIIYTDSIKPLESIGADIINQTDNSISASDSAKMSTSMLRVKLYNLDKTLGDFSVAHDQIFDAYVDMIRLINSLPRNKTIWIINLIGVLSYQSWRDLNLEQKESYADALGSEFILGFNSNQLVTILLQSGYSELIITSSYIYSLLKMLFIVFGFSKLTPKIINYPLIKLDNPNKLQKHFDYYRGAGLRRPGDNIEQDDLFTETESEINESNYETFDPTSMSTSEPVDPAIYDYIRGFADLYPTILGLMGGTEVFPPEIEVSCEDIPPSYENLSSLPEYLWRFNDYSYCKYINSINSRQMNNALANKINSKIKYLIQI